MENASKALLIAGAILICIVLISVGMLVLNSTTDVTDQVGDVTTSQAAQMFNSKYINYSGIQKGTVVKKLIETVATNNSTKEGTNLNKISIKFSGITGVTGGTTPSTLISSTSQIVNSGKYEIKISGVDNNGYIKEITISNNLCNECAKKTQSFYCWNCDGNFCGECIEEHIEKCNKF